MKKVTLIVVGAGGRGDAYANFVKASPEEAEIVAVCEPRKEWREKFAKKFGLSKEQCFNDWKDLLSKPKFADAVLICTVEDLHRDIAVALAEMKYHILLEKPMAPTEEECVDIYNAAKASDVKLAVCHVLRYTNWFTKLQALIDSGIIGNIYHIQATEYVGSWHFTHSFVRGNFRNDEVASPFLLAKCCHDIDLLNTLVPGKCKKVSSFGRVSHFSKENQPEGAADRCTECPVEIESQCPYSALKIYLRDSLGWLDSWPVNVLTVNTTPEGVAKALREGPYGRCVYACDNNVCDHQIVNLEFENGATVGFVTTAFASGGRDYYVMGDRGTLRFAGESIVQHDFLTGNDTTHSITSGGNTILSGHGGGDSGIMKSFLNALKPGSDSEICTGPEASLESHLIVFAAERSRKNNNVESMMPIIKKV